MSALRTIGSIIRSGLFGILMFTIGSAYTAFLMVMGREFIRQMSGGVL